MVNGRFFVKKYSYAMSRIIPHDGIPEIFGILRDSISDISKFRSGTHLGDSDIERCLGDVDEVLCLFRYRSNRVHPRAVPNESVQYRGCVKIQYISLFEDFVLFRHAVTDSVVEGNTSEFTVASRSPVVVSAVIDAS